MSAAASALLTVGVLVVAFTPPVTPPAQATMPGRNGRIAFSSRQGQMVTPPAPTLPGSDYDIFTVAPNGRAIQQLTQGPDADFQPAWSPDGRRIAFLRLEPSYTDSDIFVMNSDGSGLTHLTDDPLAHDFMPAWSPRGDKIAFARGDSGLPGAVAPVLREVNLHVMNADGSNIVQLTDTPGVETAPDWSPDGRLIVFAHLRETSDAAGVGVPQDTGPLEVIRPDGSGRRELTTPQPAFGPHWSPDGSKILFGVGPAGSRDVWVIGRNGDSARNLTPDSDSDDLFGVWSPDGTRIAFLSNREGTYHLYSMRSDGTQVVKLIDIALDESEAQLDWGPRP